MKARTIFALLIVVSMLITSVSFAWDDLVANDGYIDGADDGPRFHRNISRTPAEMTGASAMSVMSLYVPAQTPDGTVLDGIDYYAGDCLSSDTESCTSVLTMTEAKPLIVTYNDGVGEAEADLGTGAGFGQRDAFAALSLDDGATWKNWNLSDSALRSSFMLKDGHPYPGDVFKLVQQVEGNMVAAAWISRFCESGAPLYSWEAEDQLLLASTYELGTNLTVGTTEYNTYASDLFGVSGGQISVNYTELGFPEVGEVPYGCVWVARGTLEQVDPSTGELSETSGVYDIVWRASERLTSGRRDPHQINITSSPGAGFIIEWQEDPEGLRPGKGLGPGEGWSGAIANAKTDLWYTYIDMDHFANVCLDDEAVCAAGTLAEADLTQKPKAAVPFAVPMRLTDNNMCRAGLAEGSDGYQAYCYADFDANGNADLCAETVQWTNNNNVTLDICKSEDGRVMNGRTASTRVRWAMKPYTNADGETSAWVLMGEEKMKALGTELDDYLEPVDIGKNMWYHTFEFDNPELVAQGLMLNSPALSPDTGEMFDVLVDEWGNEYYDTEIARRFNLFVNSASAAMASTSKTMGFLIYKQGILFQGGPADIFIRRLVLPEDFDPAVDNPFAYENVQCVEFDDSGVATPVDLWYADGTNPNYVRGLCPVAGMNVSGTTIVECDDGTSAEACAEQFPFDLSYEEWASDADETQLPKVAEWVQAPDNYNDQTWENPYDVSKGHRGFIDGDFVMMMYATAPNWKAGTTGNEAYNLYIRRSFDGGQTWTTLPASYTHINGVTYSGDGTETCEYYGWGGQGSDSPEDLVCTTYGAGEFEQARNVSLLSGAKVTVLDPRYSPTGGMLKKDFTNLLCPVVVDGLTVWESCGYTEAVYAQDVRDPSAFFATYETGDNTVVTVETGASPLDMYYSRAWNFGDDFGAVETIVSSDSSVEYRWDWLENGEDWATEASVYGNSDGSKFYAVWNQELPVDVEHDIYTNMDTEFRRIFYNLDDTDSAVDTLPISTILYQSADMVDLSTWPAEEEVILIGSARDYDNLGEGDDIQEAKWKDDLQGLEWNERTWKFIPHGFIPGKHPFSFQAKDNDGNWSVPKTTTIWIAEKFYNIYLPTVSR